MTRDEFSTQFDVLYNNITSNQAPGLNEFEKSVFLTKAQSQLLNEYFNVRVDGVGGGFDGSQRRQYDFSKLIVTDVRTEYTPPPMSTWDKVDRRSHLYSFPEDYLLSVNEVLYDDKYQYSVLPVSYSEYTRLMLKPYNFPVKRAVWRLFTQKINATNSGGETFTQVIAEVIGKCNWAGWTEERAGVPYNKKPELAIRYIKRPEPIILDNLSNYGVDLTIEGNSGPSDCELPEETHQEILERAVTLAKIAWQGGTATQAQAAAQQQKQ